MVTDYYSEYYPVYHYMPTKQEHRASMLRLIHRYPIAIAADPPLAPPFTRTDDCGVSFRRRSDRTATFRFISAVGRPWVHQCTGHCENELIHLACKTTSTFDLLTSTPAPTRPSPLTRSPTHPLATPRLLQGNPC